MSIPFRFYTKQAIPDPVAEALSLYPGVKVYTATEIRCSDNSAFLVERELKKGGVSYKTWHPPLPVPYTANQLNLLVEHKGLREWVPDFLTDYQKDGILVRGTYPGTLYRWDTGSGKSLGGLIWGLLGSPCCLIVTRASNRDGYAREIERYTTQPYDVLETMSPREIKPGAFFLITSWEILPAWTDFLCKIVKPHSVIWDESHKAKSHKRLEVIPVSKEEESDPDVVVLKDGRKVKFADLKNIASSASKIARVTKRRLATTATPIKDRLRDLWAQLDLIAPWSFSSFYEFCKRYCDSHENPWGGIDTTGRSHEDELASRMSFLVHDVPTSVSAKQLPPKRRQVLYIPVDQQDRPGSFVKEIKRAAAMGGSAYLEVRLAESASRKRTAVLAHALDALHSNQKVVVFTGRRADVEKLAEAFTTRIEKEKIKARLFWGHGGIEASCNRRGCNQCRDCLVQAYMAEQNAAIFIGTTDAFGESISMHDTDLLLVAQLPVTPGAIRQAEGRVVRLGGKRNCLILYLICEETVDEHVAQLLLNKLPAVEKLVNDEELISFGSDLSSGGLSDDQIFDSILSKLEGKEEED